MRFEVLQSGAKETALGLKQDSRMNMRAVASLLLF
jgi:hypothetical protein